MEAELASEQEFKRVFDCNLPVVFMQLFEPLVHMLFEQETPQGRESFKIEWSHYFSAFEVLELVPHHIHHVVYFTFYK